MKKLLFFLITTAFLFSCAVSDNPFTNGTTQLKSDVNSATGIIVYFKKPLTWGTPKIHFWNTNGDSATTWPGNAMTLYSGSWYSYTFNTATSANIVFNNGGSGSNQTVDTGRSTTNGWCITTTQATDGKWNVSWYSSNPDTTTTTLATTTTTTTIVNGTLTLHFKNNTVTNWTTFNYYYWGSDGYPTASTSWPGVAMTAETNAWYKCNIPGANSTNIIFNNGSAQTVDLNRLNEGWFVPTGWSNGKVVGAWYGTNPETTTTTTTTVIGTTTTTTTTTIASPIFKVHFQNNSVTNWYNTYVYYWGSNGTPSSNAWPGDVTIVEGGGWFAYNVKGTTSNVIFNNGAGQQTIDLTRTGEGWFVPTGWLNNKLQGTWYNSLPTTTTTIATTTTTTVFTTTTTIVGTTTTVTGGRTDFRKETIYFVVTPRFMDGDSSTNVHCWDDAQAKNPDSDPAWRGDFKGLTEKLDYIKALGFTAIWITPPVKNCSGYDYHGYHAINFKEIDPRYKTAYDTSAEDAYRKFIVAAHAKGMKVIQDIVLNHSGNFGEENLYQLFKRNAPSGLNDTIATVIKTDPMGKLPADYNTLTPAAQYNARIAALKEDAKDTARIYHHEKSMSWESYTVQTGQIAGDCVDLNTENPTVYNYLISAMKYYIDLGVDAFRVDTVKHVSRLSFNKTFIPQIKAYAGSNFYIFGEVCSRYRQVWNNGIPAISPPFYTWKERINYAWSETDRTVNEASVYANYNDNINTSNQPSTNNAYLNSGYQYHAPDWSIRSGLDVIDFTMHWNFCNARDAFGVGVGNDSTYADATWNVTYVDSHDYAPDTAPENQRFNQPTDTWAENLSLIFLFRGIPCIFYGSEIEFMKGAAIDVGPNAPLSTTGRAYYGDKLAGTVTATDFGTYTASGTVASTLSHPLAQHIISLNKVRRAVPALQMGQYTSVGGSGMAFVRRYTAGTDSLVCVVISGDATFTGIPNGTYVDAFTGAIANVTNGSLYVNAGGKGNARAYVLGGAKYGFTTSWIK